ncbi:GtrA family protein [Rufibacter sp. XAAS-G3-1]|uniref:GtrA family protein n=1 Tax=Rufibacter sp. XAAS-G3-1 TaxID=2729134 RepID=UPI0015E6679D|nr:GtrA family protein [Rufibacter sp. XAAS-G3-1]
MKAFNVKEILQIVRFVIVGAFCAGCDFILYALLVKYFHFNYLLSNIVSTTLAIVINYFITKRWVFSSSKYSFKYEFTSFVILSLIGLFLNIGLIILFVEQWQMDPLLGKLLAIILVSVFNFISKKKIVFGG